MNRRSRIPRFIRGTATMFSAVLCISLTILMFRSYWGADAIGLNAYLAYGGGGIGYQARSIWSNHGIVSFQRSSPTSHAEDVQPQGIAFFHVPIPSSGGFRWGIPGFSWREGKGGPANSPIMFDYLSVWVPHWFLILITAIPPAIALRRWRRRKRIKPGCCTNCGYDLRASPQRCPECGVAVGIDTTDLSGGAQPQKGMPPAYRG